MKFVKKHHFDQTQQIAVSQNGKMILIEVKDINYCEAEGGYVTIHLTDKKAYLVSENIGHVSQQLKDFGFISINKSTVINLLLIKSLTKERCAKVTLEGSIERSVARQRKSELIKMLF